MYTMYTIHVIVVLFTPEKFEAYLNTYMWLFFYLPLEKVEVYLNEHLHVVVLLFTPGKSSSISERTLTCGCSPATFSLQLGEVIISEIFLIWGNLDHFSNLSRLSHINPNL